MNRESFLALFKFLLINSNLFFLIPYLSMHRQAIKKHAPVYQAIWAKTTDFDEVLISPVMLQDHMPDTVLSALEKVSSFTFASVVCTQEVFAA